VLSVKILSALQTNYIFVGLCKSGVFVVDPGDHIPVVSFMQKIGRKLDYVLITHHHHDHTAGVFELKKIFTNLSVIVPQKEINKFQFECKSAPEFFNILDIDFQTIDIFGHTIGHIGFYLPKQGILFCGDAMFSAGCGRVFEGTMAQMRTSIEKISKLPEKTKVYCAHEYTFDNLRFASTVDPENLDIANEMNKILNLRKNGHKELTIPTTIKKEKLINPFLMLDKYNTRFPDLDKDEIFAKLRLAKDKFC
jgi:hydroxyacylglutathione hydrolase